MKTPDDVKLALVKAAALYDVKLAPIRMAAYLELLSGKASTNELCAGIESACTQSKFFPTVAEILDACGRSKKLEAAEAWQRALETASGGRHRNRDGDVSEPIRRAVRMLGGWDAIGLVHESKRHFVERRFLEIYEQVAAGVDVRALACEAAEEMRGITE
jgi:hypothetical protein